MSRSAWGLFGLLVLLGLLVPALAFDLRLPDEPRVAHSSLAMAQGGELVVPTINGRPFLQTPPLYYWILGGWQVLVGVEPDGLARIPSLVFSLGTILLTALAARRVDGNRAAFLAAAILAGTVGFWDAGARVVVDTALMFFIALALYLALCVLEGNARVWLLGLGVGGATGAAFLVKGLPGLVIVASALVLPLVLERSLWRRQTAISALLALLVFALVVLPWVLCLGHRDPSFPAELLFSHVSARVLDAAHHNTPNFDFLHRSLVKFLPWGVLLPFAVVSVWRSLRGSPRLAAGARVTRALYLSWLLVPFLLLLLSRSKRNLYLLPLYPAAALLLSVWLSPFLSNQRLAARILGAAWVGVIGLPLLGTLYAAWFDKDVSLGPLGRRLAALDRQGVSVLGLGLEEREESAVAWYLRRSFTNETDPESWVKQLEGLASPRVIVGEAQDLQRAFAASGQDSGTRQRLELQALRRRQLEVWRLTPLPAKD